MDPFLYGHPSHYALLCFGDLRLARTAWAKLIDAWRIVSQQIKGGATTWNDVMYETICSLPSASAALLAKSAGRNPQTKCARANRCLRPCPCSHPRASRLCAQAQSHSGGRRVRRSSALLRRVYFHLPSPSSTRCPRACQDQPRRHPPAVPRCPSLTACPRPRVRTSGACGLAQWARPTRPQSAMPATTSWLAAAQPSQQNAGPRLARRNRLEGRSKSVLESAEAHSVGGLRAEISASFPCADSHPWPDAGFAVLRQADPSVQQAVRELANEASHPNSIARHHSPASWF